MPKFRGTSVENWFFSRETSQLDPLPASATRPSDALGRPKL